MFSLNGYDLHVIANNYSCICDLFRTSYEDWNRGVFDGAKGDKQVGFLRIKQFPVIGLCTENDFNRFVLFFQELRPFPHAFFKATEESSFFAYDTVDAAQRECEIYTR